MVRHSLPEFVITWERRVVARDRWISKVAGVLVPICTPAVGVWDDG